MNLFKEIFEYIKKWGIFAVLFCGLLWWTISGYETREKEFMQHEEQYHKIVSENQTIITKAQSQMDAQQKTLEGFKVILDVKLEQIQKEIENLRKDR